MNGIVLDLSNMQVAAACYPSQPKMLTTGSLQAMTPTSLPRQDAVQMKAAQPSSPKQHGIKYLETNWCEKLLWISKKRLYLKHLKKKTQQQTTTTKTVLGDDRTYCLPRTAISCKQHQLQQIGIFLLKIKNNPCPTSLSVAHILVLLLFSFV